MNKKTGFITLALSGTMLLAACGDGNDNGNNDNNIGDNENNAAENNNNGEATEDVDLGNMQLGTGSTGGTYYPLGQEIATAVNNNIDNDDVDISAVSSGASVDNIANINQGEIELGMSVHLPAQDALTGEGEFDGVEVDNFGFMGHIYPEVMQIVVPQDAEYESVADLEGESIAIGPPGSGTQAAAELILEAYGLEEGDYEPYEEGFGDAAEGIQDGNIDASFGLLGLPDSEIEGLHQNREIELLGLSDEGVDHIEENSGYEQFEIEADSYDFQEEDVMAITAYAILVGSTDTIDEDLGYEITKAMFEHSEDIQHPQGEHVTLDNALNGSDELPMHPGAERYFEEEGLLD